MPIGQQKGWGRATPLMLGMTLVASACSQSPANGKINTIAQSPDGGTTQSAPGIGDTCMPPLQQGNCGTNEVCVQLDPGHNMCTTQCFTSADCGTNGTMPNECFRSPNLPMSQPGFCLRSCTPGTPNSCTRADFVCYPPTTGFTTGTCLPDCRTPGAACPYGSNCDATQGFCTTTPCQQTMPLCPGSQVCAAGLIEGQNVCVPDCRLKGNTCPTGMCVLSTGICTVPQGTGNSHLAGKVLFGSATFMYGSTWLSTHFANLYVVACDPDWDINSGTLRGCRSQVTTRLTSLQQDIAFMASPWRIDGLNEGQQYVVNLFEDTNGNGQWDIGSELRLQWPPPLTGSDLVKIPPDDNVVIVYDPITP